MLSLTKGRVCRLQLLLVLASTVILGSEFRGSPDHILLSQIPHFHFVASYDSQGYGGVIRSRGRWSLSLMLRPTVSWPVCLGITHPSEAYDQIFVTVRQLRVCSCGALSLTRGWVCRLQLLLAFASAVILESESQGPRDHILLSQIRDFSFRRLLRLAGLRWRYSTPPPHGSAPGGGGI
jgi:hypothetical protein